MNKIYTKEEVSKHNTENDCWIIIENYILNITEFLNEHPGGSKVLKKIAGKDATKEFKMFHNSSVFEQHASEYIIGNLQLLSKL